MPNCSPAPARYQTLMFSCQSPEHGCWPLRGLFLLLQNTGEDKDNRNGNITKWTWAVVITYDGKHKWGKRLSQHITQHGNSSCFSAGARAPSSKGFYVSSQHQMCISPVKWALSLIKKLVLSATVCTTTTLAGTACLALLL